MLACRNSSKTSSIPSWSAASWHTASCAYAAPTAATTNWSPSVASAAGSAAHAVRGACRRAPRTWSTISSRACRCACGCFHCQSRCRLLLAAQLVLVTSVLQVMHRLITRHLLDQTGFEADEADSGAVTLIQRFGSAANLNVHLHCLVLDGVYRRTDNGPVFVQADFPTDEELQALLHRIITGPMKLLTRRGVLVEEEEEGDRAIWPTSTPTPTPTPIRMRPARRAEGVYLARRHAASRRARPGAVCRPSGLQPARGRALRRRRAPAAGTTVPDHHPTSAGQRARADQQRRAGRAQTRDRLARRHHPHRDGAAGVHAAPGGAGERKAPFRYLCRGRGCT